MLHTISALSIYARDSIYTLNYKSNDAENLVFSDLGSSNVCFLKSLELNLRTCVSN